MQTPFRSFPLWAPLSVLLAAGSIAESQILLTEFGASNQKVILDEDGSAEDWIEICNLSPVTLNLEGWGLSDEMGSPHKWRFPSTNLGPGQFLVVFASDKDRRNTGRPLHTNFKLSAGGEYLGLSRPDGTITTAFTPSFPPQATDVSYGLEPGEQTVTLLSEIAKARFHVPTNGMDSERWMAPDFDDQHWLTVTNGVGFDRDSTGYLSAQVRTDVGPQMHGTNASAWLRLPFLVSDPSTLGGLTLRMHYNDGFLAYLNGELVAARNAPVGSAGGPLADSVADWSATGQQGYRNWYYGYYDRTADADGAYNPATDFLADDPSWTWNGGAWVLGPSNPPWDVISMGGWHPNSAANGGEHWPVRRWICQAQGQAICSLWFAKENTACGSGTTLRIYQNGEEKLALTVAGNDGTGVHTNLVLSGLTPGDLIDFAIAPRGTDGSDDDACDGSTFAVAIDQVPSDGPQWNSTATSFRSREQTLTGEILDLSSELDRLTAGTNILAIHGLNLATSSPDFLMMAELLGVTQGFDTTRRSYFPVPSPARANSGGSTNLGPIIDTVEHSPREPADNEDLVVRARVSPSLRPIQTVTLRYRVMYQAESTLPMFDDGAHGDGAANDGIYGARIPATLSTRGQMIRYLVSATDHAGVASREPAFKDPVKSPQYFGTVVWNPALTNGLPVLHWFIQNPSGADSDATARVSIHFRGEFYDNVAMDVHGQSTRGFPKKSYDLDFNPGFRFRWDPKENRVDDLNLLTTWADKSHLRNVLAHETYRDAGAPSHFAFPVRVERNAAFFSVANIVENGGEDFLERVGLDPRGALYKMYNSAESVSGAEKKSRRWEGNADLQALITGMSQSTASAREAFMFDHLDVPEIINFLAAKIITADTDCCHKNYYLYRDSDGSGEWHAMPWDVDLSFGRVWTCGTPCLAYYDEMIYTNTSIFVGSGNRVFSPFFSQSVTRQMFLRRLRSLMDHLLQGPETPAGADAYRFKTALLRDQTAPDAALDLLKWGTWGTRETITQAVNRIWNEFLPGRRGYLFRTLSVTNRGEIPESQPADAVVRFHGMEPRPASGNQSEEWLSLTNANNYAIDLSGWRIAGAVRFTFEPGTVLPSRAGIFVSPNVRAFRSRLLSPKGGERRLVVGPYSGNLSTWGETLSLIDSSGRIVATNSWTGLPSDPQRYLRITEIFYHPDRHSASPAADPQDFEFIELLNTGPLILDLRGIRFVEGINFDFTGASVTNLPPGGRVLVVKNRNAFTLRYGMALPVAGEFLGTLDNGGERIRLEDAFSEKILDFEYHDTWHPITDGHGYSLAITDPAVHWSTWELPESWRVNGTPGGTPAASETALALTAAVVINEVLAHTDPPQTDTIELLNLGETNVNLGNWFLTDDFEQPRKFRVPDSTILPAGGSLAFSAEVFNRPGDSNGFGLSSEGDEVWLFSADASGNLTGYVQGFDFDATVNGVSLGRHVNSAGTVDYPAQKSVTLGQPNSGPLVGPVVISEIMYHPPAGATNLPASYIELASVSPSTTPLYFPTEPTNTWRLRNAVDFDFPLGVRLPAGERLLVVGFDPITEPSTLSAFRNYYGIEPGVAIYGPWQGRLGNSGEVIELKKPDPAGTNGVPYVLVEKVAYADSAAWPIAADGAGASLQRLNLAGYANEPTNWFAASPSAGAVNRPNTPPVITLVSPENGASVQLPAALLLSALATDPDGTIQSVMFAVDGQPLVTLTNLPYTFAWSNASPGFHKIEATATDDRLASATSPFAHVTVVAAPPQVTLTAPGDRSLLLIGEQLPLTAAVSGHSPIDRVEFHAGDLLLARVLSPPYSANWTSKGTGTLSIVAVAADTWGTTGTSAPVKVAFVTGTNLPVRLSPSGTHWKYLDDGSNQGIVWRNLSFDDTLWKTGAAELGYGEKSEGRPEATELSYGTNSSSKHITYYFRREFSVAAPSALRAPYVRLLRDDGAIVYLNGVEIFRSNLPGSVDYLTPALNAAAGAEETTWFTNSVAVARLREGQNVLAVEVHQSSPSSSDLSFDLALEAGRVFLAPAIFADPPDREVTLGEPVTFGVIADGSAPLSYQWMKEGKLIPKAIDPLLHLPAAAELDAGSYSVTVRNTQGAATSAAARLTVRSIPSSLNRLTIRVAPSGYEIRFTAAPGTEWEIQRTTHLGEWTALSSETVPENGTIVFTDQTPPASAAFYRAVRK